MFCPYSYKHDPVTRCTAECPVQHNFDHNINRSSASRKVTITLPGKLNTKLCVRARGCGCVGVCACACVCTCARVYGCVRARACVCACVCGLGEGPAFSSFDSRLNVKLTPVRTSELRFVTNTVLYDYAVLSTTSDKFCLPSVGATDDGVAPITTHRQNS